MRFNLQIKWIEEQNQVFSSEIYKFDVLELSINNCSSIPVWGRFRN